MEEVYKPPCTEKTELFFPPSQKDNTYPIHRRPDIVQAKALCETCKMKTPCFERAIVNNEIQGIWGGVFFGSRRERDQKVKGYLRLNPRLGNHKTYV